MRRAKVFIVPYAHAPKGEAMKATVKIPTGWRRVRTGRVKKGDKLLMLVDLAGAKAGDTRICKETIGMRIDALSNIIIRRKRRRT